MGLGQPGREPGRVGEGFWGWEKRGSRDFYKAMAPTEDLRLIIILASHGLLVYLWSEQLVITVKPQNWKQACLDVGV